MPSKFLWVKGTLWSFWPLIVLSPNVCECGRCHMQSCQLCDIILWTGSWRKRGMKLTNVPAEEEKKTLSYVVQKKLALHVSRGITFNTLLHLKDPCNALWWEALNIIPPPLFFNYLFYKKTPQDVLDICLSNYRCTNQCICSGGISCVHLENRVVHYAEVLLHQG